MELHYQATAAVIVAVIVHSVLSAVSETKVTFESRGSSYGSDWTIAGTIDRVTGDVMTTETVGRYQSNNFLKCKLTQRMF